MTQQRIHLWSGPRNISTAIMYSFAQRSDTHVIDEPLYAHYLSRSGVNHPGRDIILQSQKQDGNQVLNELHQRDFGKPVVFFKQMTHHLTGLELDFLNQSQHIILIRNPRQVIASYARVRSNPELEDLGVWQNAALWSYFQEEDIPAIVIDSEDLLRNPEALLRQMCSQLDLDFEEAMLSWQAGPRPEDGVWAPYWYGSVHKSEGFHRPGKDSTPLDSQFEILLEEALPYYQTLKENALSL